jgi:hypothetical protein
VLAFNEGLVVWIVIHMQRHRVAAQEAGFDVVLCEPAEMSTGTTISSPHESKV